MNYGHAYHAGNHTEVFKHSVLCALVSELLKRPKPFTVLDTHAGAGIYDLRSPEARRTGEAQEGIGRIFGKHIPAASAYLDIVQKLNPAGLVLYPGSPAIVQALLRKTDRLIACELHREAAARLQAHFRADRRVSVHHRDGYESVGAFVPFPTKRGLVFIDPPFERSDEFDAMIRTLISGSKKWPTGIYLLWYPIKNPSTTRALRRRLSIANVPTLSCQFLIEPAQGDKLVGSGIVLCNPPWQFENTLSALCHELLVAFAATEGRFSVDWWVRELEL